MQNYNSLLQEGVTAAQSGNKAAARSLLLQATKLQPDSEVAWFWLSYISDNPQETTLYLRRVLEIAPEDERARQALKKALLYEGITMAEKSHKEQAHKILQELISLDPNNEVAWLWLAWLSETTEEIIYYLQQVININPHNDYAKSWLEKVESHAISNEMSWTCPLCEAPLPEKMDQCAHCKAILTINNLDSLLHNEEADERLIRNLIDRYEQTNTNRDDFTLHFNLALAYFNVKQLAQGLKHLQMASQIRPEDGLLCRQVELLLQQQDKEEQPCRGVVLVVDDSCTIRKLVSLTLERRHYRVVAVADGMQALAKLHEVVPDLILLDINMPNMDGYQVCKFIKKNELTKDVPVIILSDNDTIIDKMRGRMAGSTEYLTKPFRPNALLQVLEKHCKSFA